MEWTLGIKENKMLQYNSKKDHFNIIFCFTLHLG